MVKRLRVLVLVLCLGLTACRFFPESCFDLAAESRLPKWFSIPQGLSRSDVILHMCYYTEGEEGREAEFVLWKRNGWRIAKASGHLLGNRPLTLEPNGKLVWCPRNNW